MKSFKNDSTWYLIKFTQVYKLNLTKSMRTSALLHEIFLLCKVNRHGKN